MCCSLARAEFSRTVVMVNAVRHLERGVPIHALAYQNVPVSRVRGAGNAMLLHFPTRVLAKENIVDTSSFPGFLDDVVRALTPPLPRGFASSRDKNVIGRAARPVEIFDHDIYTIAVSSDAAAIPDVLSQVRADRRPVLNPKLFDWYQKMFPGWSFALCCFNNQLATKAKPMLWWYEPLNANRLMLPGIDSHTGDIPNLETDVGIDHWVAAGVSATSKQGRPVSYGGRPDAFARSLLPDRVWGRYFSGKEQNGDFILTPIEGGYTLDRGLLQEAA